MDQQAAYQAHAINALTHAKRSHTKDCLAAQNARDELKMSRMSHGGSMNIIWPRDSDRYVVEVGA
jgi:hypothetical protein